MLEGNSIAIVTQFWWLPQNSILITISCRLAGSLELSGDWVGKCQIQLQDSPSGGLIQESRFNHWAQYFRKTS